MIAISPDEGRTRMILWAIALVTLVDTCLICVLVVLHHKNMVRYIKLEEWTEDWLKRLEQKHDALECQIVNAAARIAQAEQAINGLQELLPKNGKGEIVRYNALLQQMNDEMERSLKMEREWNEGVAAIMNYSKPIVEVNNNE